MTTSSNFAPPFSGPVLNALVGAFDLRRWDRTDVLSQKTSRRYLAGERVGDDAEWRVHRAIAAAIVASDLVPAAFSLPEIPVKAEDTLAGFIQVYAKQWDQLAGAMRRMSAPVEHHRHAASAFLRLVVIDLAARVGALLWLLRGPDGELPLPVWCEPRGAGMHLRSILDRCGDRKPSRDEIALDLSINFKTVDGWLDGQSRPDDDNILALAKLLSSRGAGDGGELAREIRLMFSLEVLARMIAEVVGQERMIEMTVRLIGYANVFPQFLPHSKRPREMVDETMRLTFLGGTFPTAPPWLPHIFKSIWRQEPDPVWRTDLMAVTGPWLHRLQDVAMKLGPTDKEKMRQELGFIPSSAMLDEVLYRVQASRAEQMADPRWRMVAEHLTATDPTFGSRDFKSAANEAAGSGDLLKAIELAREAIRLNPADAEIHFRLGAFLWQVGDVEQGLVECEISAQLKPDWDRPRAEIGLLLLNLGRDGEALQKLEASKRELSNPTAWFLLILSYAKERNGDVRGAILNYEELLGLEPDDGEALDRLAHLYFVAGEAKNGIDRCKKANQLGFPTVFTAWENGYYKKGKPSGRPPQLLPEAMIRISDWPWSEPQR